MTDGQWSRSQRRAMAMANVERFTDEIQQVAMNLADRFAHQFFSDPEVIRYTELQKNLLTAVQELADNEG